MNILLIIAGALALLVCIGWLGLQVKPRPFPVYAGAATPSQTLVIRETLSLTVSVDHDVVDGAPATRFSQCLKELIESGYGLDQEIKTGRDL